MTQEILDFDPKMHEAMFHLQRDPKFSKLMINPNKIINLSHISGSSSSHSAAKNGKTLKDSKNNSTPNSTKNNNNPKAFEAESRYPTSGQFQSGQRSYSNCDEYSRINLRTINFYRDRNAYLEVLNGCRIYRIQSSDSHKTADIFVNYIPMNVFEQELVELFEQAGQIETLRLVMHDS